MNDQENVVIVETIALKMTMKPTGKRTDCSWKHVRSWSNMTITRTPPPAKLRVENLHFELTEDDIYVSPLI